MKSHDSFGLNTAEAKDSLRPRPGVLGSPGVSSFKMWDPSESNGMAPSRDVEIERYFAR